MVTEVALAAAKVAKTASEISAAAKAAETKSVIKSVADVAKDVVAEKAKGKGIENIGDVVKEIVKAEIKSAVENEVLEYFDPDVKILVNDIKKISGIIDEFKSSRLDKVEHPDPRTYEQTNKDDSGNHIDDSESLETDDSGEETNDELSDEKQSEAETIPEEIDDNSEKSESEDSAEEANDELSNEEQFKAESVPEETDNNSEKTKLNDSNEKIDGKKADSENNEDPDNNAETKNIRELTDEEKQKLKDILGWTDRQISKCMISEDGVIHYKTDREDLEGKTAENGVRYERKTVEINGVKVEGVFPVFNSKFDAQLPDDLQKSSNVKQFSECNRQLKEAIENNPELAKEFTDEQLEDIKNGDTPEGYTWHHNEEAGKMQLVKSEDHDRTQGGAAHTGGKALWGGKIDTVNDTKQNDIDQNNSEV